jgi:hypothetical protein
MTTRKTTRKTLEQMAQEAIRERMAEDDDIQVYKKPWVGLTIEEIAACCMESTTSDLEFAQAIEAKLKEKNG